MKFDPFKPESPTRGNNALKAPVISGSADWYGACSIEDFPAPINDLSLTHDDASGFLDYPTQFAGKSANFWLGDGNVKVWIYEETYDNWQDTYGADAVTVFYHSGHGNMDSNGVFQCPMGGTWDNRSWAFSNQMSLGNETLRYLFWSTCLSLRVLGGHSPIRTWHGANKGMRMIFGFETTSVDDARYGKFFWDNWKAGKSFSKAWLDGSWSISDHQAPSVCAMGATQAEAQNRVGNERFFSQAAVSNAWYWWLWYNSRSVASPNRKTELIAPADPKIPILESYNMTEYLKQIADSVGISRKALNSVELDKNGTYFIKGDHISLAVGSDGRIDAQLAKLNLENDKKINEKKAQDIAEDFLQAQHLGSNVNLKLHNIINCNSGGATSKGSGKMEDAAVVETIFEFRQNINGLPTINNNSGLIRIGVDNDGHITSYHNSTKGISDLSSISRGMAGDPDVKGSFKGQLMSSSDIEAAFGDQLNKLKLPINKEGISKEASSSENIIASEVGHDISGSNGKVVARRTYELEMGDGLKKLYKIQVPIFE